MLKQLLIVFSLMGTLVYVGLYSYQKAIEFGGTNYYLNSVNASKVGVMTIRDCEQGVIPGIPSLFGKIKIEPQVAKVNYDGSVKIINGDSIAHTVGVVNTKVWEVIEPGDALRLELNKIPTAGLWRLTCDGINLGDASPGILVFEL